MWLMWEMAEEVNEKLPEHDRFNLPLWQTTRQQRLYAEYQRLNPSGRGHNHIAYLMAAAWVLLVVAGFSFWKAWR
jgi:hypothetical protein